MVLTGPTESAVHCASVLSQGPSAARYIISLPAGTAGKQGPAQAGPDSCFPGESNPVSIPQFCSVCHLGLPEAGLPPGSGIEATLTPGACCSRTTRPPRPRKPPNRAWNFPPLTILPSLVSKSP